MLDDNKHTERVAINLTEREYVEACRACVRLDMKPPEYIRYCLRLSLFGTVGMEREKGNSNRSDE